MQIVTVKEVTSREVELSNNQCIDITIRTLEKHFNLKKSDKVEFDELKREIEYNGHRVFRMWETMRKAQPIDIHVLKLIKELCKTKD